MIRYEKAKWQKSVPSNNFGKGTTNPNANLVVTQQVHFGVGVCRKKPKLQVAFNVFGKNYRRYYLQLLRSQKKTQSTTKNFLLN